MPPADAASATTSKPACSNESGRVAMLNATTPRACGRCDHVPADPFDVLLVARVPEERAYVFITGRGQDALGSPTCASGSRTDERERELVVFVLRAHEEDSASIDERARVMGVEADGGD